jgi:hypothetical protein
MSDSDEELVFVARPHAADVGLTEALERNGH